jgi:hypothetical protein
MLVDGNLKEVIQKHRAKKLKSFSEATSRYLDRFVWFEDKTTILILSPHNSSTGMRSWIAQGEREKR